MEAVLLNEIIEKTVKLKPEERKILIRVLQEQENKPETNGGKGFVHPNTLWVKKHRAEYAGKYVALEDGRLVGTGGNFPEASTDAKKNGSQNPMITYVFPLNGEPFGGW